MKTMEYFYYNAFYYVINSNFNTPVFYFFAVKIIIPGRFNICTKIIKITTRDAMIFQIRTMLP